MSAIDRAVRAATALRSAMKADVRTLKECRRIEFDLAKHSTDPRVRLNAAKDIRDMTQRILEYENPPAAPVEHSGKIVLEICDSTSK